jgi:muramoyltetrapeptide carboxypeptidase
LLGTPLQPDLTDHVLMLEEVAEYMYRIDRFLFHITSNPGVRRVSGIMLGRCSGIPSNGPDFGQTEEETTRHWCEASGIPYLGRADIGMTSITRSCPSGDCGPPDRAGHPDIWWRNCSTGAVIYGRPPDCKWF